MAAKKPAPAKKTPAKKSAPAKAAAKKAPAKKPGAKKAPAKKAPAKKAPAKKAPAKKAPAKKAPAKRAATPKGAPARGRVAMNEGAPGELALVERPPMPPILSNADVKILCIDDDPDILEMLVPYLRGLGYTVFAAEDGDYGLQRILEEHPNIVLLDVEMPGMNGWEIAAYVRKRAHLEHVRIIMATGIGEELNAATAPVYRADATLDKPFLLADVGEAVARLVEQIKAAQSG